MPHDHDDLITRFEAWKYGLAPVELSPATAAWLSRPISSVSPPRTRQAPRRCRRSASTASQRPRRKAHVWLSQIKAGGAINTWLSKRVFEFVDVSPPHAPSFEDR
jgi:hypothetical protein